MTLDGLKEILKELKIPLTYDHFDSKTTPPYLVYLVTETQNLFADNKVIQKMQIIDIELYTKIKNVKLEEQLEKLLTDNELPYEIDGEFFIEEENVFQIIYKITI